MQTQPEFHIPFPTTQQMHAQIFHFTHNRAAHNHQ